MPWICISTTSLPYHDEEVPPYAFEDEQEEGRSMEDFYDGHKLICNRYNEVRKEFNLPPVKSGWNDLFSKFLTICVTTPELEYPRSKFPEGLAFTGALTDPSQDPNLDTILQEFINNHSTDKIIYATLGTVFNKHPNLMEILIRGVFLSKATAIISSGPGYTVSDELLAKKPDNVIIVPWANHRALFPYMWAAVTHGGMSTTSDTIYFGLPTLHIPVGCDLPSLSRKLMYNKAGLRIPLKYATPEGISTKINELIASDEMKNNVAKLQKAFKDAGGASKAVKLIESALLKRSIL
jgi:MGT family glycosyltransferase